MKQLGLKARIYIHLAIIPLILVLCGFVGWTAGDYHWPYIPQAIDIEGDPVSPGGVIGIQSTRKFLDDCDLEFERQLESVSEPGTPPVVLAAERIRTPWHLDGKPQKLWIAIPLGFPCGPAQLRTKPSASCNWMQVGWLKQRSRDVLTPFEVACR